MKKNILIVLFGLFVILQSCNNEINEQVNNNINKSDDDVMASLQKSTDADAYITIMGSSDQNNGRISSIVNSASFKQNGALVTVNAIKLDDLIIPESAKNPHSYYQQIVEEKPGFELMSSKFSKKVKLKVDGGANFPSFEEDIKIPNPIVIRNVPTSISKSKGITLEFSPNQGEDEHLDIVMLYYNSSISKSNNPEMPNTNINFYKYDYEKGLDHFTFTSKELERFPTGSVVNIKMVRFIRNNFYVEGKRIEVDRTVSQLTFAVPIVE